MNEFRSALDFCFEYFTSGLAREYADERAQVIVWMRVDLVVVRVRANGLHVPSSPRASCSSSFGHDTPAHSERRCLCFS